MFKFQPNSMSDLRSNWLNKLRKLNPNRSRVKGAAPHKPCLLLSLLDMVLDGELIGNELRRTPGLNVRFIESSRITVNLWWRRHTSNPGPRQGTMTFTTA